MDDNRVEILLVEDNPHDAEMTIRTLKKINLANRLVHLKDGAEALDFIFSKGRYAKREATLPRLILLDLKMPRVDGIDVLRKLKAEPSTRMIPVVVLTSSAEETDMVKSYQLGVNSYVVKPVDFVEFMKAVSDLGLYWLLINRSVQPD